MSGPFDCFDPVSNLSSQDRSRLKDAWLQSPAIWRFVPKRGCPDHLEQWLGAQSPADWHEIATNFDMDNKDYAPLMFIARQPLADRATVMSMLIDQDIVAIERAHANRKTFAPRSAKPKSAKLLDEIQRGFKAGYYPEARFRLRQGQRFLGATRTDLASIGSPPCWEWPEQAWAPIENKAHTPEFVWDREHNCQRLPFNDWAKLKLRPQ